MLRVGDKFRLTEKAVEKHGEEYRGKEMTIHDVRATDSGVVYEAVELNFKLNGNQIEPVCDKTIQTYKENLFLTMLELEKRIGYEVREKGQVTNKTLKTYKRVVESCCEYFGLSKEKITTQLEVSNWWSE